MKEWENLKSWEIQAYAKLGAVRDELTPEEVKAVQRFIAWGAAVIEDIESDDGEILRKSRNMIKYGSE